jgi:MFS family permease
MALVLVLSHGVLHLTDLGYTSMQAAYVSMSILIASAAVRFPIGWLGDRVEPRWLLAGGLGFMVLSFVMIWQAPSFLLLMIFGPIYGMAHGSTITMTAPFVGNYFSPESYPSIMSVVTPIMTVCVATVPAVAGLFADNLGNYDLAFAICGIGLAISFALTLFLAPPRKNPATTRA